MFTVAVKSWIYSCNLLAARASNASCLCFKLSSLSSSTSLDEKNMLLVDLVDALATDEVWCSRAVVSRLFISQLL